jgi:hypothetical protein
VVDIDGVSDNEKTCRDELEKDRGRSQLCRGAYARLDHSTSKPGNGEGLSE